MGGVPGGCIPGTNPAVPGLVYYSYSKINRFIRPFDWNIIELLRSEILGSEGLGSWTWIWTWIWTLDLNLDPGSDPETGPEIAI